MDNMETAAEVLVILSSIGVSVALAGAAIRLLFGAVHTEPEPKLVAADQSTDREPAAQ
jgi:hypothetical protein